MTDKLILVFYIGAKDLSPQEIHEAAKIAQSNLSKQVGDIIHYVVPDILSDNIRVECLNPVVISDKDLAQKFYKKLEEVDRRLDRFNAQMFPLKRNILTEKIKSWIQ